MTLPASGQLSIGDINVEMGYSRTQADSSLQTRSTTDVNTASSSHPDQTAPHAISEFYSYDDSATGVPANPTGLSATVASSTEIDLSWTDVSGETSYTVYRSTDGTTYSSIGTTGANVTSYNDTALTQGKTYWYEVTASNSGGESGASSPASATTTLPAPSALSSTGHDTSSVDLSWTDNSADETGFAIQRAPDSGGSPGSWSTVHTNTANDTTYTDTGLSYGTTYWYRVKATGEDTDSSWTSAISVTTTSLSPPSSPTITSLYATGTSTTHLVWSPTSNTDTYNVRRSPDGSSWTTIATGINAAATAQYDDSGLTEATQYYYEVQSVNAAGSSAWSASDNTYTEPTAPSGCTANKNASLPSQLIDVNWTINSSNATGQEIWRNTSGGSYSLVHTISNNTTNSWSDSVSPSTTYCYKVLATTPDGTDSSFSNSACATTDSGGA